MYLSVLAFHNLIRWLVLVAGVIAVVWAITGWAGKRAWGTQDKRIGLLFTVALDVQILLGLLLYGVFSPITTHAFANFGAAMGDATLRFWLVEHLSIMLVAAGLAHTGRALSKKATSHQASHQRAALFFGLALAAIVAGIPWFRSLLPQFLGLPGILTGLLA